MKCKYCNNENEPGALFCQNCGKPITINQQEEGDLYSSFPKIEDDQYLDFIHNRFNEEDKESIPYVSLKNENSKIKKICAGLVGLAVGLGVVLIGELIFFSELGQMYKNIKSSSAYVSDDKMLNNDLNMSDNIEYSENEDAEILEDSDEDISVDNEEDLSEVTGEEEYMDDSMIEDDIELYGIDSIEDTDAYILPDSSSYLLSENDIAHLGLREINYAKNEIYARKGRIFKSQELQNYFNSKSWYYGTIAPDDFKESMLTEIERKNAAFLSEEEHKMKPNGYPLDQ